LQNIRSANKEHTKKEIFKDLLNRLYSGDRDIESIIDAISTGAERTVLNIPRGDKLHKGSADTLYNKIIIEFENDLRVTLKHAKEQLAGYLLGQFNSGEGYNFTLIVSDFITWKVFAPDVSCLDKLDILDEGTLKLNEVTSASITLTDKNTEDFYYWIDRFLFKEEKHKATLKRIEEAFGYQSTVFIESFRELSAHFRNVKKFGEVQVAVEQWNKFLSIAYGSFDGSEDNFLIHTYLSVFSKMLAYTVLSNDDFIDDEEMKGIIDGSIFFKFNIRNFVDNDFFHWIKSERNFPKLKKVFRLIAQEISTFDFHNVDEDILKGVYQELIDLDTRHALGEYYTPDWLCERIVNEFQFKETDKILDPACGSGSFLLAVIHKFKKIHPELPVAELNNRIYGIDIHPLSVQIAKTTILLALGKEIAHSKKPVHLNIILANTLLAPDGVKDLFGETFRMLIDKETLILNSQVLEDVALFDEALETCDELADQTMNKKKATAQAFETILKNRHKKGEFNTQIIESFYKIYESLRSVKEKGRDSIWKFIVQNLYKPYFLSAKFDYVIGNPPWFTYNSIKNEEYQDIVNQLAEKYSVKPAKVANFPHLEIAAIFLAYCSAYFLKEEGRIAFVLPRSFFSADHHDNSRSGKAEGYKLTSIWDLNEVSPLFRIPSCVLFARKAGVKTKRELPADGLEGRSFSGQLKVNNCNLKSARDKLTEEEKRYYYSVQGGSSAFSLRKGPKLNRENPYKSLFRQGATIVPRTFYFVDITQEMPHDFEDRTISIRTSEAIQPDAKAPWKGITLEGQTESRFLFRTALAKSILPFALYKPDLVVLPVTIELNQHGEKELKLYSADDLRNEGYLCASKWFGNVEHIWELNRTAKSEKMTSNGRLNYQNGLTGQNFNAPYMVIYNGTGANANAVIVERGSFDLDFIVDYKSYVIYLENINEAFYISALLNSNVLNEGMKDFQSKGLFGARDVSRKILDIYYPRYDENNPVHKELAELSKAAHEKAGQYVKDNIPQQELSAGHLGRLRGAIKKHLSKELGEIDGLVKKIIE
jgi:type I restriction-modification system DNA methylase subunit